MQILETQRLILREMTPDDLPALCLMLEDPEVMYAYEGAFTREQSKDWLNRQIRRYQDDGIGLWAAVLKTDNRMIGQCGLTFQNWKNRKLPEVGYLFQKAFWHQGYAAEGAVACRDYAFSHLKVDAVYSIIRDTNLPSRRVAERNGMTVVDQGIRHYRGLDMPHLLYEIKKARVPFPVGVRTAESTGNSLFSAISDNAGFHNS